jgi:hypothetical protein
MSSGARLRLDASRLLRHFFGRPRVKNPLAFVFYSTSEHYAAAVLVFVHLLRELGMRGDADVLLLHFPLPPAMLDKARRMEIITRPVAGFRGVPNDHYRHCFVKLRALALTEYERILFADADAIPLKSLDPLLSLEMKNPIAAPLAYWLPQPYWTSALFLAQPSRTLWRRVRPHIDSAGRTGVYDMDILNKEFAGEIDTLPPDLFCLNSEWEQQEGPSSFAGPQIAFRQVSLVHFTALGKPLSYSTAEAKIRRQQAHPEFFELWDRWRQAHDIVFR